MHEWPCRRRGGGCGDGGSSGLMLRKMHQLELDAVGIGKKDRIVAGDVIVLAGRVEDSAAVGCDRCREAIDLSAAFGAEGDLAKAYPLLAEGRALEICGLRHPD